MPVRSLKDGTIKLRVDDNGAGSEGSVTVNLEEGDLSFTERTPVVIHRDRGVLDHARKASAEALELAFSMMFQSFTKHADPTPYQVLKKLGSASSWVSQESNSDAWAVDVEFTIADPAGGASEVLSFDRFVPEEVGLQEGEEFDRLTVTGRSPRPSAFPTPEDIPGLFCWTPSTSITGLSDGQAVSSWPDLSGYNHDLDQATGTKQPTYQTNELNGLPVVRFDGSDDFLRSDMGETYEQPNTIFLVAKHIGGSVTADEYMFCGDSSAGAESHTVEAVQAGTDTYGANAGTQQTFGTLDTSYHIFIVAFDGASSIVRLDRTQSTKSLGTRNLAELIMGIGRDLASGAADIDVADFAAFRRKLSVAQMRMLEDYASWKYAL